MEICIYNGEQIKRGPLWYIIVFSIAIFLVVYTFLQGSIFGALSIVFIFFVILVGYVLMYINSLKKTFIKLEDNFLQVGDKMYELNQLDGFNLEFDKNGRFKTLILLIKGDNLPLRYTICDDEKVKEFAKLLIEKGLTISDTYNNDKLYKLARFLKLI